MHKKDHTMAAAQDTRRKSEDGLWETVKVIIQALLIAFVVRTFFYQPFNIPSASMYPTLKVGDYLFVSKLSYGYGKYSFNFSLGMFGKELVSCCPIDFPGRVVLADTPERGDVAVFKLPTDTDIDYIKRVIGLPGDRVQMRDGILFINGQAVKKERIEDFMDLSERGLSAPVAQFQETLPNGVTYHVLDTEPMGEADNTEEYVVPEGHYFMMGDNRDNSQDSRYMNRVGYVPIENFVGRADIIFFSVSPDASLFEVWRWPFVVRWSRFFNLI
ncbi:signal peptidase I [Aestuariivirga sp.]|uniref:signal peptidase I n=1 Tax=Aestuariivirga sp. TaxID=2650926 RepID=UPI00359412D1